jgi:hypothetical protein
MPNFRALWLGSACLALWTIAPAAALPAQGQPGPIFVTIGSGDPTGVYYPVGKIIARMLNDKRHALGIRAAVEATKGSGFNVDAIRAGTLEFGLVQSDVQYQAANGLSIWAQKGPCKELRSVFSLHRESVCLVAAVDAGIETIADLRGKRVNLGNPRSGQYRNAIDALQSAGLVPDRDILAEKVKATDAPLLLQDHKIDAFFCTLGHPNETLRQAVSGPRQVRFVPITDPGIDRLIAEKTYYAKTTVPVQRFYREARNTGDVETFGVIATLCTSARVPDHVVYRITNEVLDNFDSFSSRHPAFTGMTKADTRDGLTAPLHPGALYYFRQAGLLN